MNEFVINQDRVLVRYQGPGGSVRVPDGVTDISSSAFPSEIRHNIAQLILPEGLETIRFRTFEGCGNLTQVWLPSTLKTIEHYTFAGCSRLERIVFPDALESIGEHAFESCQYLQFDALPAGLKSIGARAFARCTSLTELVVPDSVEFLDDAAFSGCSSVKTVRLSDHLKQINTWAFQNCSDLETVHLPSGATAVKGAAFSGCGNLKNLDIPDGVEIIDRDTFSNCVSITTLVLPKGLKTIGRDAFAKSGIQSFSMDAEALPALNFRSFPSGNAGVAARSGDGWRFYGFASKTGSDNLSDTIHKGKYNIYDLELINNGPVYKYKAPARLLGSLGRIVDPVDLTDECRELHMEFLIKNAKKLIPLAEALRCPAIVEAMAEHGIINAKNKKAIAKLLEASAVEEIAAIRL